MWQSAKWSMSTWEHEQDVTLLVLLSLISSAKPPCMRKDFNFVRMPAHFMRYARYTSGTPLPVPSINLRACHKVVDICVRAGQCCTALSLHLLHGLHAPQQC